MSQTSNDAKSTSSRKITFNVDKQYGYPLEQLRIAMGEKTLERALERAYGEFVKSHGAAITDVLVPEDHMQALRDVGYADGGNVRLINRATTKFILFVPDLAQGEVDKVLRSANLSTRADIMETAINDAIHRYVA